MHPAAENHTEGPGAIWTNAFCKRCNEKQKVRLKPEDIGD